MNDYLITAILLLALLDLAIMPAVILRRLKKIDRRLDLFFEEEEPSEPSNVIPFERPGA